MAGEPGVDGVGRAKSVAEEELERDVAVADWGGVAANGAELAAGSVGAVGKTDGLGGAAGGDTQIVHGAGRGRIGGAAHLRGQMVKKAPDGFHLP